METMRAGMKFPVRLKMVEAESAWVDVVRGWVDDAFPSRTLIVASPTVGRRLVVTAGVEGAKVVIARTDECKLAEGIARDARNRGCDLIVGIGGGRTLDVAKFAAARSGVTYVAVPTAISHDGLASPVAVLRQDGETKSLAAVAPYGVVVPMPIVRQAPRWTRFAALGDVVGNLVAVGDWEWAAVQVGEGMDDYAALIAEIAATRGLELLGSAGRPTNEWWRSLTKAVVLSSLSMCVAGTSRPASGSEHLLSHAMDRLGQRRFAHGLQVAFATVLALVMFDDARAEELVHRWSAAGVSLHPDQFGLDVASLCRVIEMAPSTRPGRVTRLETVTPALQVQAAERIADLWAPIVAPFGSVLQRGAQHSG